MPKTRKHPLRSGGHLWGPLRVRLDVSLDDLATASGTSKGILSLMENGRLIPSGEEYERITAALGGFNSEGELRESFGK